jgi:RimJ/RimL family protein N-acetyltransferase
MKEQSSYVRAIETSRLRLRPFKPEDIGSLEQVWNEPGVRRYLWDDKPVPRETVEGIIKASVELFEKDGYGLWAVVSKYKEELLGFCGFWHFHDPPKLELLFGIATAHWNQGLASEAATAMLRQGFGELAFDRIVASTDAGNEASVAVMRKIGMTFWKREETNGLDTIYYAIFRDDFPG